MATQRITLNSSALAHAVYDDELRELTVTFHSGRSYSHPGVPPEVAQQLADASSPGQFYNSVIKGVYV